MTNMREKKTKIIKVLEKSGKVQKNSSLREKRDKLFVVSSVKKYIYLIEQFNFSKTYNL